jgi:putative membrane protein
MADPDSAPNAGRFEVRVTSDSHFSWIRTRLSIERTMMSWIRTATALIGFGFAIVQFFQRLEQLPGVRSAAYPNAPRDLGLALISCGVLALLIAVWQYLWIIGYLWGGSFAPIAGPTREGVQAPIIVIAILLIGIGVFAFFAVLLRLV